MKPILSISLGLALASSAALADVIKDWNLVMIKATETAPVTPAPVTTRVAAIVEAAVFDAVNGIERQYSPIFVRPAAPRGSIRTSRSSRGGVRHAAGPLPSATSYIRSAKDGFAGANYRQQHRCSTGSGVGPGRCESDMGVEKPGRILRHRSPVPGRNESRTMAAHSASHGAWPRSAVGHYDPVGDAVAFTIPPCRSASPHQRSIYSGLRSEVDEGMGVAATNSGTNGGPDALSANFWQALQSARLLGPGGCFANKNKTTIHFSDTARLLALAEPRDGRRL